MTQNTNAAPGAMIYQKMGDPIGAVNKLAEFFHKSQLLGVQNIEQGRLVAL